MATSRVNLLIQNVSTYITDEVHLQMIKDAVSYATKMHEGQMRKSGEDYIIHPLEVAIILTEYKTDPTSIVAGILHDVIEDTPATHDDIEARFGREVALLVEGVTKLGQYKFKGVNPEKEKELAQAQNYQKMLLAMSQDIRVIIVKLADRLNNIRTLGALAEVKQKRIAKETMEIYAPLAHRLGMYVMKAELEDTCFKYLEREKYLRIARMIADTKQNRESDIKIMQTNLEYLLSQSQVESHVKGRIKNIYSVHKKMAKRHKDFEDIYDLLALRVVVDTVEDCYRTIGIIHSKWTPIPNRFKDYIAMPKPNLYQSLHTSVIANGKIYEIQIRTPEMDQIAEYGVAAHWAYKESNQGIKMTDEVSKKLRWFGDLVKFTKEADNKSDVLNMLRDDIFQANVYVFTPGGDIIDLPKGSCPIDFAFRIHTEVGIRTVGAIVNGKIVPLEYQLETGDVVNIRTSTNSFGPNDNWLKIVKTSNAKSKIKNFLNKRRRKYLVELGREDFAKIFAKHSEKIKLTDQLIEENFSSRGAKSIEDLYYEIGKKNLSARSAVNTLVGDDDDFTDEELIQRINDTTIKDQKNESNIIVAGIDNPSIKLSNCCTPIPGDRIKGYISKGAGIAVHRVRCNNLKSLDENRLIDVYWGNDTSKTYMVNLKMVASNRDNVLAEIINTITAKKGKVSQVTATTNKRLEGVIKLRVVIKNKQELENIIIGIQNIKNIISIERLMK